MRRLRLVASVLAVAMFVGSCSARKENAITVDIGVEGYDAASVGIIRDSLVQWDEDHPDVLTEERIRLRNDDFYSLGQMGADHLPDVFVTDSRLGRLLAEADLVVDLSAVAPDVSSFTYDGRVFAFPVLRESMSVVFYDPSSWDGSSVGFDAGDRYSIVNCYLGSALADDEGRKWFGHMTDGDFEAAFTDGLFTERLDEARELLSDDTAYESRDALFDAFISGECSAAAVYGDAVFSLLDQLKTDNPDLYGRVEFASPDRGVPSGFQYGVFIRVGMSEERTLECVDLARVLSSSDVWGSDPTVERLLELRNGMTAYYQPSQYFIPWFWNYAWDECFATMYDSDKTSQEYACILQNYYEMYYIDR